MSPSPSGDTVSLASDSAVGGDWLNSADDFLNSDPESDGEMDSDDPFEDLAQSYDPQEALGVDLPESAANLANRALRTAVPVQREKELADRILRPRNVEALQVPKVNLTVWKQLQRRSRETDINFQKAQALLHKGLVPILQTLGSLKAKKDKENLKNILDSFIMLAASSHALTTGRRMAMNYDLFACFKPLCAPNRPFTDLIFGPDDELDKTIKKMADGQQQGTRLGYGPTPRGRHTPRGRGSFRGRGQRGHNQSSRGRDRPFLGGRGSQRRRGGLNRTPGAVSQTTPDRRVDN